MGDVPRWFGDKERRRTQNKRSQRQERERAAELNGKVQAGSGSSYRAPQDIQAPEILEQIKYTDGEGVRVNGADLVKLLHDASRRGRKAQYTIDFERFGIRLVGSIVPIPGPRDRR